MAPKCTRRKPTYNSGCSCYFCFKIPKRGDQPFLSVHPNNIFTMLQRTYPINGYESVTSLCPINTCASANPTDLERLNATRLRTFLKDASVVFGHRVLPQGTRNKLPVIGQSWGSSLLAMAHRWMSHLVPKSKQMTNSTWSKRADHFFN